MKSTWHDPTNAAQYHRYAAVHPLYKQACDSLLTLSPIGEADRILELACGTGVSTAVIAERCSSTNKIVATDFSGAQIGIAKSTELLSNVSFVQAHVVDLPKMGLSPFDLIVCNAAIWYFDLEHDLPAIHSLMGDRGRLVFNLLPEHVPSFAPSCDADENHSKCAIIELAVSLAEQRYGYRRPESSPGSTRRIEPDLSMILKALGLTVLARRPFWTEHTIDSLLDWYRVPLFLSFYHPDLPYEMAVRCFNEARALYKGPRPQKTLQFIEYLVAGVEES